MIDFFLFSLETDLVVLIFVVKIGIRFKNTHVDASLFVSLVYRGFPTHLTLCYISLMVYLQNIQPMSMVLPGVVGFKLTGKLRDGVTATDLVLTVTQMLRKHGVVGKFVEFYGKYIN